MVFKAFSLMLKQPVPTHEFNNSILNYDINIDSIALGCPTAHYIIELLYVLVI